MKTTAPPRLGAIASALECHISIEKHRQHWAATYDEKSYQPE
jgi:hypothetical protein